jgi:alpha-L-rhamnosidase
MKTTSNASIRVQDLRCEYERNPLGIDVREPRLSWKLVSEQRGVVQSAYQIRVTDEQGSKLWDTGKVLSDQSLHVPYAGPALHSRQHCTWQVRVWDGQDQPSDWSEPAWWEMGLLHTTDWQARWIEPGWNEDPQAFNPCPYLRTTFLLDEQIVSARLYVTAHGLYEAWLNGQRVGDAYFSPGYTSYHHRLHYQTYDVGALMLPGENAIGVILGDGWYRGKIGAMGARNVYGEHLGLLLQLQVRYADGREQLILSDDQWRATTGPILASDLQDGERYDARLEMPGWNRTGFDSSHWQRVRFAPYDLGNLVATIGPKVGRKERFTPVAILTTPAGETVVDMGQNFSGVVQLRASGQAGTTIRLQHGETLDKAGNFTLQHLALPFAPPKSQEVSYTLKGEGEEVYMPHFTTMGFRYVKIEGFPGTPTRDTVTGIALYSDMSVTGTFTCSDPLVNRLQHNILWSQKSNFLEIPTDCPTRERAGWTGDAQIFARTGSFLMQTAAFFTKWLKDLAAEQRPDGLVNNMVPTPPSIEEMLPTAPSLEGSAGWGDAAVIVPWTLYQVFGDRRILQEQYASMKAWIEYERRHAPNYLWNSTYHFGEWLEPDTLESTLSMVAEVFAGNITPEIHDHMTHPHVATAYFAYSTRLLSKIAGVLGKTQEAEEYAALHEHIRDAYVAAFVGADGQMKPDTQASYVRALALDLLPERLRPLATRHLVERIQRAGSHLATGFLSTPFLLPVLSDNGYLDVAYALLKQETPPSWLYAVKKGATTVWENWNGIDEEGNAHGSLNHYSYGAVGSWLYQVVAGLEIGAAGYKHIRFQPQPGNDLTEVEATYQSLYGEVATSWQVEHEQFTLTVTVPANTTATVCIPARMGRQVTAQGQALEAVEGVTGVSQEQDATLIEIGSGTYTFITVPALQ